MSNQSSEGTPIKVQGRIVWAVGNDLFKGEHQKDDRTKQLKYNQDGSPKMSHGFGLALPIASLQPGAVNGEFWAKLMSEVAKLYPNGTPPEFAWKFKDGNTAIDRDGKPYRDREGYADAIVLSCTTTWPVQFFRFDKSGNVQVNEGINPGDYVNVQLSAVVHAPIGQGKPGLYLNPLAVQLITKGTPIIGKTVNPDAFFGNTAPALPPGVSAMPEAPAGMPMPGYTQPAAPGMPPVNQPAPHYGILPGQHQPQAAPTPAHHQQPAGMPMPGQPMGNAHATTAGQHQQQPTYPGTAMPGYVAPAPGPSHNGMPVPGQPTGMPNFPGMTR